MANVSIKVQDLVTFAEAAIILGKSRPTVYAMVERKELRPVLIGKSQYLLRTEVEEAKVKARAKIMARAYQMAQENENAVDSLTE